MPHVPHSVLIPGERLTTRIEPDGSISRFVNKDNDRQSVLQVTGVKRAKPKSEYIPPTPYFLKKVDTVYPFGTRVQASHHTGASAPTSTTTYSRNIAAVVGSSNLASTALREKLGFDPEGVTPPRYRNEAILKARMALKGEFDAAVFLAEWSETNAYVKGKVDSLTDFVKKFRKAVNSRRSIKSRALGAYRRWRPNIVGDAASRWLEFRYAIMPFVYDCYGVVEAFAKLPLEHFLVTAKRRITDEVDREIWLPKESGNGSQGLLVKVKGMMGAEARIDCLPQNLPLIIMQQFGVTNPAAVAWEATRLSFVVDWFVPIGDFLSQFDALLGYQVKGFSVSELTKLQMHGKGLGSRATTPNSLGRYTVYRDDFVESKHIVRLNRTVSSSVPLAVPRFRPNVSGERVVDAISLLRQAFSQIKF